MSEARTREVYDVGPNQLSLQVMPFNQPEHVQCWGCDSFCWTRRMGKTPWLGLSKASRLFELWLYGICNSRSRVTTASGNGCDGSVTCCARDWPFILSQGTSMPRRI